MALVMSAVSAFGWRPLHPIVIVLLEELILAIGALLLAAVVIIWQLNRLLAPVYQRVPFAQAVVQGCTVGLFVGFAMRIFLFRL